MTAISKYLACAAIAALAFTATGYGATTFVTNDNGNAADLDGAVATTITSLTLSSEDGGGTLNLTTSSVLLSNAESALGMDANSLGVNGDKFGINGGDPQTWIFSFDQTLSFDGFTLIDESANNTRDTMYITSSAWIGNTVTDGSNWSFNSTTGTITTDDIPYSSTAYDFTGAGLANITSGTTITMALATGNGGTGLQSFTVSPIPEPSTALLAGLFSLTGVMRRRR